MNELRRHQVAIRDLKVQVLRARRLVGWATRPDAWRVPDVAGPAGFEHSVHELRVPLSRCDGGADPRFEAGKRINIGIAAPHFDGRVISADTPLSFWRLLGRPTRRRGFVLGAEVRAGCVVPTLGGGLCLLSNAIFRVACELGWTVLERHGHTMRPVPDPGELVGLDATVFWPFVDLRVAPRRGRARLGVRLIGDALVLDVRSDQPGEKLATVREEACAVDGEWLRNRIVRITANGRADVVAINRTRLLPAARERRNCFTCNERDCHARPRDMSVSS